MMVDHCDFFLPIFVTLYAYIDKTWQPSTMRHWSDVYSHCFHPSSCAIHPVNNWNEVRGSKANSNPHRYLRVLCIPLYFPWEYLPGRLERNETDPVRGNADCALRKGAWQTFWEESEIFSERGRGKIAPFGKGIDIIVVIPLFTIGARMYNL